MRPSPDPSPAGAPLRRFWWVSAAAAVVLLLMFGVFEWTGASRWLELPPPGSTASLVAAALSIGLLVGDVILPVPSSVVMLGNGALFGFWLGALVSMAGGVGATVFGLLLGRLGKNAFRRWVSPEEHERATALLERHGTWAIVATRPIPIVAETVALVAGASRVGLGRATLAGALGSLPGAALYAWAGATGLGTASDAAIFGLVILIAGLLWVVGRGR